MYKPLKLLFYLSSAAFFHGQVEQPVRGIMSLVNHKDVAVVIAINERGIFIIDPVESVSFFFLSENNNSIFHIPHRPFY